MLSPSAARRAVTPPVSARQRPSSVRIESVRTRLSRISLPRRTTSATSRLIVALPRSMTARRPLRWVDTARPIRTRPGRSGKRTGRTPAEHPALTKRADGIDARTAPGR